MQQRIDMDYNKRRYLVIPTSIINEIDFNEIMETSLDTLVYSIDGTKTFIKYDVSIVENDLEFTYIDAQNGEEKVSVIKKGVHGRPTFYSDEYDEYDHEQFILILNGENWKENEQY